MAVTAPAAPPAHPAAWEILQARKGRAGLLARCGSCRRPAGLTVLAWQDGHYAVLIPDGRGSRFVVFTPWGHAVLDRERGFARLETPGWRPVEVQLDAAGLCPRCAYCQRHHLPLGVKPAASPQDHTRRNR